MNKYYKYDSLIDTQVDKTKREIDTLIFFKDLYVDDNIVEYSREILYSEVIPPSAIAEISAYCTTTWEDSCPQEIKEKCRQKEIEYIK